jgi:hypothetical protein
LKQYLSKCGGYRGILLPGGEVPNWFSHKRIGSSISFQIPSLSKGQIKGFFVCAIYAPKEETVPKFAIPSININSRTFGRLSHFIYEIHKDHSCLSYIPVSLLEAEIASGMELKIDCEVRGDFEVKKCGIHLLVNEPNAIDEYINSDTSGDCIMDTLPTKRGRDDNEAGPSNNSFDDGKCPKRSRIFDSEA